ncbi:hypothetical protein [Singulisphaera sp. PoT]|uniref:hypothetical protein n=1 Tax=Singulisphaera sp. PoT TaxID=3411797 RepID=UPI003BF4E047
MPPIGERDEVGFCIVPERGGGAAIPGLHRSARASASWRLDQVRSSAMNPFNSAATRSRLAASGAGPVRRG